LLLAGRLDALGEPGAMTALLDRLGRHDITAQVVCAAREETDGHDERVIECPAIGHRWQHVLAVRKLRPDDVVRRPELIHVLHTAIAPAGLALAERWGVPYIQGVDEFLGPRDRLRISKRWCRVVAAASEELAGDLVSHYGVPAAFVDVVAPGVPLPEAGADFAPARANRVAVIGTAGPLVPASGFAVFLSAARRVLDEGVDAEFVIAGQGEDEVDLRRRADRLRIADRVTFAGQSVVGLRFWHVLDVFCQTSLVPTVGRHLALAMVSGVPSIASDLVGLHSLVEHGVTGLRVPADDSAALARTIVSLLGDPEQARALGRQARERILRRFHPDERARDLAELYHALLEREPHESSPPRPIGQPFSSASLAATRRS
jgi:glycosyltransferase involved in cell wall biosynthesis